MKTKKTRLPLEKTYNDEDTGVPEDPTKDFVKTDEIEVEGADPESLLTSETEEGLEAENVAERLHRVKQAGMAEKVERAIRRAAEAAAGWTPKRPKKELRAEVVKEPEPLPVPESERWANVEEGLWASNPREKQAKEQREKAKGKLREEQARRDTLAFPETLLSKAAEEYAKTVARGKDRYGKEVAVPPAVRAAARQEMERLIEKAAIDFDSVKQAKRKAFRATFGVISPEDDRAFIQEVAAAVGRELKRRHQLQRESKADLSGRDKPVVKVEPAEVGEELFKKESVGWATIEKRGGETKSRGRRNEEKFLKHRQEDKEKTLHLGRRQKINDILEARVESGGKKGIEENVASQRLKDFFDVQRDSLSDGSATLSEEEVIKLGRFTALDFFDFADDIKDAPGFSSLAKVAGRELRARLERDSDLAQHFLNMIRRNDEVRKFIPHFADLEETALKSVENPLSPQAREQLEKRYGLVVKEKNEMADRKGWDEEKLSYDAYIQDQHNQGHEAYKYQSEKDEAEEYYSHNRKAKAWERRQAIEEKSADEASFQQDKGLVRRLLDLLSRRGDGSGERRSKVRSQGASGRPEKVPPYKTRHRPEATPENRSNP